MALLNFDKIKELMLSDPLQFSGFQASCSRASKLEVPAELNKLELL